MKKLALLVCLLVATVAAQAQFEKGKWILNPSISGLGLSHNTETDKTSFGIEAKGGAFLLDNVALLIHPETFSFDYQTNRCVENDVEWCRQISSYTPKTGFQSTFSITTS